MKATPESLRKRCDTALQSLPDAPYRTMLAALFGDLLAEVERLAAQSAPTEIHADTPRHELLPRLRRLASDFQSHPLSRSISECEEAGIAMAEAAKQIEMLCRTRNTVVNHSGRMRKEIAALTEHRDFLLREIAKIDGDPGNACHYAIEAISAVCADLAEPVPPLPEPEPTYTDDLELRYAEACEERDHLRAVLADRAAAQVEQSMPSSEWLAEFSSLLTNIENARWSEGSASANFDKLGEKNYEAEAVETRAALLAHLSKRVTAQVEPVRMLTQVELTAALDLTDTFDAIQANAIRAFCRVNAGKRIPADGEVRS